MTARGFTKVGDRDVVRALEKARAALGSVSEPEPEAEPAPPPPDRDSMARLPSYHRKFLGRLESAELSGRKPAIKFGLQVARKAWEAGAWFERPGAMRLGLLVGPPGSGRTTALTYFGVYAACHRRSVRYLSAGLLADLQREKKLDAYRDADLLLIDNLHATPPGQWQEVLAELVQHYHADVRRGLVAAGDSPMERLQARAGAAVISQLTDTYAGGFSFDAEDSHG